MGLKFASFTLSSKDAPGRWSLVVFLKGCNFRCKQCHNWRLVASVEEDSFDEETILEEIALNPVVDTLIISGGEPTIYKIDKLLSFIERTKRIKPIEVRIDTNGYNPIAVEELIKSHLVDGFAIDIKAPLENKELYSYTTGIKNIDTSRIERAIYLADGLPLTIFRTPKYPWLSKQDIEKIFEFTQNLKSPWLLNEFIEVSDCPF